MADVEEFNVRLDERDVDALRWLQGMADVPPLRRGRRAAFARYLIGTLVKIASETPAPAKPLADRIWVKGVYPSGVTTVRWHVDGRAYSTDSAEGPGVPLGRFETVTPLFPEAPAPERRPIPAGILTGLQKGVVVYDRHGSSWVCDKDTTGHSIFRGPCGDVCSTASLVPRFGPIYWEKP